MNKRILAATLGFCLMAGGIAAVPRLVDETATRQALSAQVEAATGARLDLSGPGQFTFGPWPTFQYENATLASPDGGISARLSVVRVTLSPVSAWFSGAAATVEVDGFSARIQSRDGFHSSRISRQWLARLQPFALSMSKGEIVVESAPRTVLGAPTRRRLEIDTARVDWPRENAPIVASARGLWNGRVLGLVASAPSPARLAQGETGAFSLEASAEAEDAVSFDGTLAVADVPVIDGVFDLTLANPLATAKWLGETRRWPSLAALSVSGTLSTTKRGWSLSRLKGSLGDATADGGLSITVSQGRPLIQGTLAFDQIDLRLDRGDAATVGSLRPLFNEAIAPDILVAANIDVLVSTNRLRLPGVSLSTVSGALILREGRLRVEVSDGELGGGRADGHVEVRAAPAGFAARGRLALKEVRIGDLLVAVPPLGINAATMSFQLDVNAQGASPSALLSSVSGRCESDVSGLDHGAIHGLPSLGTSEPFSGALDQPIARAVRFDRVKLSCDIQAGRLGVSKLEARVGETSAQVAGRLQWSDAIFDMTGTLTPNRITAPIPIGLTGPWSAPLVTPLAPPSVN